MFIEHWKWSASQDGTATKQKNKTFKNFQITQNKKNQNLQIKVSRMLSSIDNCLDFKSCKPKNKEMQYSQQDNQISSFLAYNTSVGYEFQQ